MSRHTICHGTGDWANPIRAAPYFFSYSEVLRITEFNYA